MRKSSLTAGTRLILFILAFHLFGPAGAAAQRERQAEPSAQDDAGRRFFEQLRSLFGRFRDTDLRRAFDIAQPITCSALVSDNGEWRPLAFFNEDRKLGDFYHRSLDEVKTDPTVFIFKGECSSDRSSLQLTTKFPVGESLDRYLAGLIDYDQLTLNVNPQVTTFFDPRSESYRFELPYLYAVRARTATETVYSLVAARATDRYAPNVTNRWNCKSVNANDVTFQFLICETSTTPRNLPEGTRTAPTFGASAYYLLSDGREASTSVRLSFGGPGSDAAPPPPPDTVRTPNAAPEPLGREYWQIPTSGSKIAALSEAEFRIRFSPQTWADAIGSARLLLDQKILSTELARIQPEVDHCVWRPASLDLTRLLSNEPDADVAYTLATADKDGQTPVSLNFEMKTHNGFRLGALQCFFPQAESASSISFDRWIAVVGGHLTLEIRP
jgi:hypothetical protein